MRLTGLFALLVSFTVLQSGLVHAGGGDLRRLDKGKPIKLYHSTPSAKGTVLMFHGYTSTPQQWAPEARRLHEKGYDVLVAALPGHAFVDRAGAPSTARLPMADEVGRYKAFAHSMFNLAAQRSGKVHVVGLSVGGAHALEVAITERNRMAPDGTPILRSAVAVNPYLGHTQGRFGPFRTDATTVISRIDRLTFGLLGKALKLRDYKFDNAKRTAAAPETVGLDHAPMSALLAIGRFGDQVLGAAKNIHSGDGGLDVPTYLVVSDKDPTADPTKNHRAATYLGATDIRIPGRVHDLITPVTNPTPRVRERVSATIDQALEAGEARTGLW